MSYGLGGGAVMAAGQAVAADRPRDTAFGDITNRLEKLHEILGFIEHRTGAVVERAFGPTPDDAAKTGPAAVPNGALDRVAEVFVRLEARAARMLDLCNALDRIA